MTTIGKLGKSEDLKVESKSIEDKIRKLLKVKGDIEKGLVEVETKKSYKNTHQRKFTSL